MAIPSRSIFWSRGAPVPMEALGPRPRDLTVRTEREVDRRVRFSTLALFMIFLVGSLTIFALLAEFNAQALSGVFYIIILGAYGASFGYLLWRSSRRELALTRLTSLFIEGLPVGVIFVDPEGTIVYANPSLGQSLLGR